MLCEVWEMQGEVRMMQVVSMKDAGEVWKMQGEVRKIQGEVWKMQCVLEDAW